MATKAQILSREMILPAYKAAMLTSFIFSYFLLSSLYICREASTNPHSFIQNKPNLPENLLNASSVLAKGYEADIVFWPKNPKPNLPENQVNATSVLVMGYEADIVFWPKNPKPNSNPIYQMPEMNLNKVLTMDYENICLYKRGKTNPKQTQIREEFTEVSHESAFRPPASVPIKINRTENYDLLVLRSLRPLTLSGGSVYLFG